MRWIAAVAILSSVPAFAQLTRTTEQINVSVIEVDATVLDSSGNPVSGLKPGDFELRVGGRRTPITNFYEVNRRAEAAASPGAASEVARRDYLVVFIDDLHLRQSEKKRALDALRKFVRQRIRRGTAAMLVALRGNVHILQRFTEEPQRIVSVIDAFEREPAHVDEYDRERRDLLNYIDEVRRICQGKEKGSCDPETIPPRIESLAQLEQHTTQVTIAALDQVSSSVSGLDGRRVLVYVSDGLAMQPAAEISQYFKPDEFMKDENQAAMRYVQQAQPLDSMKYNMSVEFQHLAQRTAAAGVQFFAIDARGVRGFDEGVENGAASSRIDSNLVRSNLLGPVRLVADETGGDTVFNTNDMNLAFEKLDDHLASYYSLGFRSEASDRDADIQVSVRRPGLTVHATRHVRQRTAREQIADRVRASLYSRIEENPLGVELSIEPLKARSGMKATMHIPVTKLSILPQGSTYGAAFSVFVAMIDDKDRETPVRMFVRRLTPTETAEAVQMLTLDTGPGSYTVSFAITDAFSSETSYLQRDVTVPNGERPSRPQ